MSYFRGGGSLLNPKPFSSFQKFGFASSKSRFVHLPHETRRKSDNHISLHGRIRRRRIRSRLLDIQSIHLGTEDRDLPSRESFQLYPLSSGIRRVGALAGGIHTPSGRWKGYLLEVLGSIHETEDLDFGQTPDFAQVDRIFGRRYPRETKL